MILYVNDIHLISNFFPLINSNLLLTLDFSGDYSLEDRFIFHFVFYAEILKYI